MAENVVDVRNKRVLLKNHVSGWPIESDFVLDESTRTLDITPGSTDVLVKTLYLSVDPYLRGRMRGGTTSYIPPFVPGQPLAGTGVGKVVKSGLPGFKEGDYVVSTVGWEEYTVVKSNPDQSRSWTNIQRIPFTDVPLSYYTGILGLAGFTAWVGFHELSNFKAGEKLFVSAASGAVGQLVGQFAKLAGCYVVGSAGSDAKVRLLTEKFGFDDGFNYNKEDDLEAALRRHFPDGIDIYFDNVGGKMLDAVLLVMNAFGRVIACGMISQYNLEHPEPLHNIVQVVPKRITITGFIVSDHSNVFHHFLESVYNLIKQNKITYIEDVAVGLENAPSALLALLSGKNVGKQVVKVADE